jgi:uncharacterized membrane protein
MSKAGADLPAVLPPLAVESRWRRDVAPQAALTWLKAGWRDFWVRPQASLAYGLLVFAASVVVVGALFLFGADYILFPALAGFMVVGPVVAIGLYEKSRQIAAREPVSLWRMIFVRARSQRQILFTGVLLCGLMLLWMRAAVIIYALFFGLRPFPGAEKIVPMLFSTPVGWAMLFVGSCVGALFAAFSFAVSVLSIPMMMERGIDALTAMGTSFAITGKNLAVMLTWGAFVLLLFVFSLATGLLGLIVVFPVLGHGTWHAYRAMVPAPDRATEERSATM